LYWPHPAINVAVVQVILNGEPRRVADGICVGELIRELGLGERRIAVELNQSIVPRETYAQSRLREGDVIEIVHFIGGG